jgi:hypothetical protein
VVFFPLGFLLLFEVNFGVGLSCFGNWSFEKAPLGLSGFPVCARNSVDGMPGVDLLGDLVLLSAHNKIEKRKFRILFAHMFIWDLCHRPIVEIGRHRCLRLDFYSDETQRN